MSEWLKSKWTSEIPTNNNLSPFRGEPSAEIQWHGVTKLAFEKASEQRGNENPRRTVDIMLGDKLKTSISQLQLPKRVTEKGEVLAQERTPNCEPASALFEFLEAGKVERETKLPLVTRALITEDPVRAMLQKLPEAQIMRYVW